MSVLLARRLRGLGVTLSSAFALACCVVACSGGDDTPAGDETLRIELRWVQGFPRERRRDVETGMAWVLSFLGARLPASGPTPMSWRNDTLTLRLDEAVFEPAALASWRRLLAAMKASEEYERMGAIDVGRFVALTLCTTRHYYALTGAEADFSAARSRHAFDPRMVAVVESSVSTGERLIEVAQGNALKDIAFVAHEGEGSIQQGAFSVVEHELLDVMPNGQLRFALYDASGALKTSASPELTAAGKPSKCLWCHETELSRPFRGRTSVAGYLSLAAFTALLAERAQGLSAARAALDTRIDFRRAQDHTYAELLYLSFYEPSAERLAAEWGLPVARVETMLSGLTTHAQTEFAYLGDRLYEREQVDALAPFEVLAVPSDPREGSESEPDLLD